MHSSDNAAGRAPTSPPAGGDDSGLHDIRALAETTQRRSRRQPTVDPDEALLTTSSTSLRAIALPQPARTVALPLASPSPSHSTGRPARTAEGSASVPRLAPPAQPVQPAPPAQSARPAPSRRAWIAGAGVAGAAAVAAFVVIGSRGGDPVAPAAAPVPAPALAPIPAPAVVAIPAPPEPAPAATATATPPATETASPTTALTGHQESAPAAGTRISAAANEKRPAPVRPAPTSGRPAAAAAPAAPAAKADRGPQTLDDLLDGASGGAHRGAAGEAAGTTAPAKRELGRADIKAAMSAVQGPARACYDRYGVAGTVGVKLVVASSGSVSKVQATGTFAGTPTGDCVVAAVQGARFPAWDGAPMTVQYSFLLSE